MHWEGEINYRFIEVNELNAGLLHISWLGYHLPDWWALLDFFPQWNYWKTEGRYLFPVIETVTLDFSMNHGRKKKASLFTAVSSLASPKGEGSRPIWFTLHTTGLTICILTSRPWVDQFREKTFSCDHQLHCSVGAKLLAGKNFVHRRVGRTHIQNCPLL